MSGALNFNIFIILLIILLSVYGQENNDLCPKMISVLCVKDVLLNIASTAKEINDIAGQIEKDIYATEPTIATLDWFINHKLEHIRLEIPSKHHHRFMEVDNNINRTGLINLIKEENYAYSYLYNSIENILKIENAFGNPINQLFEKILNILQKNILCNYRNILYVYSEAWLGMHEISGIHIINVRKRTAPSVIHNGYSIVVARLLGEWMKHVNDFVVNIDKKI